MKAGGIILSGGKSSRMGTNKSLLKINQKPNIERIKDELDKLVSEIVLVSNNPETYQFLQLNTVSDVYPGQGPLAGIHAGLLASSFDVNLIVACDMPFISMELGSYLLDATDNYDAVLPVIHGKHQPLFAVYRKSICAEIEACIVQNELTVRGLLKRLNVRYMTEADLPEHLQHQLDKYFFNMNRPEEYEVAKRMADTEQ
ncbi:molybdenum cofactor guanylyltransferase [Bacillus marasmi]|uniref:molybdenum cofactor guanylyltransferase n=1 Tax=Bacillus marasmi TaxID=1926279 RepID=UPI0011CA4016|nr:molybdenum cofactor guanylyltransferase [Bacillus marasmi]